MKLLSAGLPGREKSRITPLLVRPQIEIPRHKFRPLIHAGPLGIARVVTDALKGLNRVLPLVAEACIGRARHARESINGGQYRRRLQKR